MSGCGFADTGNRGDNGYRSARQAAPGTVRFPDLGNPPMVQLCTGFGFGSGASVTRVGGIADASRGLVAIAVGTAPAATGSLALLFPSAPPASAGGVFVAAEFASLSQSGTNPVTITWTATRPLVPGETVLLAYEWINER